MQVCLRDAELREKMIIKILNCIFIILKGHK